MTKVINFCAGPSAGKTTAGLTLAGKMKTLRKNVLYVPEVALEMVVAKRIPEMEDQLYLFGEQAHRLYMAKDEFDYVVTDAPLFMQLHYLKDANGKYKSDYWRHTMAKLIMNTFDMYENYTYFVDRADREFIQTGRIHNEEQSKDIDREILYILNTQAIDYRKVAGADEAMDNLKTRGII